LQFTHKIGFPGDQFHGVADLVWKGSTARVQTLSRGKG
jgi:hypothetical protein